MLMLSMPQKHHLLVYEDVKIVIARCRHCTVNIDHRTYINRQPIIYKEKRKKQFTILKKNRQGFYEKKRKEKMNSELN